MKSNGVTLKQMAHILGISVSTVSKALSNSPEISNRTKVKVQETADLLNYKPNIHASALRNNKSFILGIILPDLRDNFFMGSLNGITEASSKRDYKIMVYQSCNDYHKEVEYANLLAKSNIIDGLIYSSTASTQRYKESEPIRDFKSKGVPIIYIKKQRRVNVNSSFYEKGVEVGKESVNELLSKINEDTLHMSA